MRFPAAAAAGAAFLSLAAAASAQNRGASTATEPGPHAIRISLNLGVQASSPALDETITFQQYVEQGSLRLQRAIPKSPLFDASLGVRVFRQLYAGAALDLAHDEGSGDATATVPHPFYFNQPRTATSTIRGLARTDVGVHLEAAWVEPITPKIEVVVFGGPSILHTSQVLATSVSLSLATEVYPFDSIAFPKTATAEFSGHTLGYHVGGDVSWLLRRAPAGSPRYHPRTFSVGFLARYSRGSVDLVPVTGMPMTTRVGGLQVGGGLRAVF